MAVLRRIAGHPSSRLGRLALWKGVHHTLTRLTRRILANKDPGTSKEHFRRLRDMQEGPHATEDDLWPGEEHVLVRRARPRVHMADICDGRPCCHVRVTATSTPPLAGICTHVTFGGPANCVR